MRNLEELYDATQVMEDTTLFCFHADNDPLSFDKAVTEKKWIKAMDEEIHAIEKNDTLKLTYPPEKKKAIGVKRVYTMKAKLVDKGYKQKEGIERRSVYAWHDIPRLSLRGRFVELNSIQKVPVKEGNHPPPAAATSRNRQPPSHHWPPAAFTRESLNFCILNLYINRVPSFC